MTIAVRGTRRMPLGHRIGVFADRQMRWLLVWPAVLLLLLIGLFPLLYALVVSFQNISMIDEDTTFTLPCAVTFSPA